MLEHLPKDTEALCEIKRVLKSGDYLILGDPNEGDIIGKILRIVNEKMYDSIKCVKNHAHFKFYNLSKLSNKLIDIGFEMKEAKCACFLFPFSPIH